MEVELPIHYKGDLLDTRCRADFVCGDVLVETKALARLGTVEVAQVINYLKAGRGRLRVGLPINFGAASLETQRLLAPRPRPGSEPDARSPPG